MNSRKHLIRDAILIVISSARKVNKQAAEYEFSKFAIRKDIGLYPQNYVNSE